jgi:cell cycle sensor histidine kinase DivJ
VGYLLSSFEAWISTLVNENVILSPADRTRHFAFIATRLATSLVALAAMPLVLAFGATPVAWEMIAFGFLMMPLGAVVLLSRTGKMIAANTICLAALVGFSLTVALGSGGPPAAALSWLMLAPFEAIFTLSSLAVVVNSAIALLGVLLFASLCASGLVPGVGQSSALGAVMIVAPAILYAAVLARVGIRLHNLDRDEERRGAVRYRNLAEAIGDLVLRFDRGGAVLFASRESEPLFGLSSRELMARGFFERVHVADRPIFLKAIAEAASVDETVTATFRLRRSTTGRADLMFVWVEMRARRQSGDEASVVIAVVRDVMHAKLREEEIEQARLEALQANAAKDRFLANVSHELRTPLNAIIGFSEILGNAALCSNDAAKQREYAGIIHVSGQHLLSVVNSLLDMSKIEAGSFDIVPEPFELPQLIDMCCDMMSLKATETGVELIRAYSNDLDELIADKRAIKQILINLLSNAVKFTRPSGKVTVAAQSRGNSIAISVADTGIGILPRDLPRLGDPFFQASDSYDRPYEGTGLGLSIVRGLVGLHGGEIAIESAPGAGTCVTVFLPADCRRVSPDKARSARIEVATRRTPLPLLDDQHDTKVKKIA